MTNPTKQNERKVTNEIAFAISLAVIGLIAKPDDTKPKDMGDSFTRLFLSNLNHSMIGVLEKYDSYLDKEQKEICKKKLSEKLSLNTPQSK
jgi:hypothetical protein